MEMEYNRDKEGGEIFIAKIQLNKLPSGVSPYPYFIEENGDVGRQDFWKGNPLKLLGFSDTREVGKILLSFEDFRKELWLAIELFPVFINSDGTWMTEQNHVESVGAGGV